MEAVETKFDADDDRKTATNVVDEIKHVNDDKIGHCQTSRVSHWRQC